MQKIITHLPTIQLVGITARTSNMSEINPQTAKIGSTAQKYFHNKLFEKISNRKSPGTTYCVYTNYESDFTGDYTYFIGEAVTSFDSVAAEFETLSIPEQDYVKFISQPGLMPGVCIDMWKQIWAMKPSDLGGNRAYIADFEVYDERSTDYQNTVLDVYVGIKKI